MIYSEAFQWFPLSTHCFFALFIQTDPSKISLGVVFVALLKLIKIHETDIKEISHSKIFNITNCPILDLNVVTKKPHA